MTLNEESVFAEAMDKHSPHERAAFLDRACAGNPGLRQSVESLLSAYDAGQFLEAPAPGLDATIGLTTAAECPGAEIGPYKLLEQIGEGGMGLVFMADQLRPVRRRVALKIIKPGMDSQQVIARFEAERQALALMDHANIARVFDAGTTASGRPYFAMELVRGIPITDYCDEHKLAIPERLELFVQVCQAVQHAHQKGVIHRDLKPTNVLVAHDDTVPMPKIIDFGIAKAISQPLTERTLFTALAQVVGTPLYMSPEQAALNHLDVDTRSDVYSLGVQLYELLTGTTPFDGETLRKAGIDEMRRIIREDEPPRPSMRVSTLGAALTTVSHRRGVDPRRMTITLRGDLDWIVMKALEKDRQRRYESASALAADVGRYLNDEPVEACAPSPGYRLRKFARRNRRVLMTVAVIAIALVGATVFSTWQAVLAKQAAKAEVEQSRRKERTLELALETLDQVYLQIAEERFPKKKTLDPWDRELLQRALTFYEKFTQENDAAPNARHAKAKALIRVGQLRTKLGLRDLEESEAHQEATRLLESLVTEFPENAEYRSSLAAAQATLGDVLTKSARYAEAETCYRRAATLRADLATLIPDEIDHREKLARILAHFSILLQLTERPQEAEQTARRSLEIYEQLARQVPEEPRYRHGIAQYYANRAVDLKQHGQKSEAAELTRKAIEHLELLVQESSASSETAEQLAQCCHNLAVFFDNNNLSEQEKLLRRSLDLWKQLAQVYPQVDDYQFEVASSYIHLATVFQQTGHPSDAHEAYGLGLGVLEQTVANAPEVLQYRIELGAALSNRAIQLRNRGQWKDASEMFQRAIDHQSIAHEKDPQNPTCRRFLSIHHCMLGTTQEFLHNYTQAAECYRKSAEIDPTYLDADHFLAKLLTTCPDPEVRNPAEGLDAAVRATTGNPAEGSYWGIRGVTHYRTADYHAAVRALEEAVSRGGENSAWVGFYMSMALWQLGDKTASQIWFDRMVSLLNQGPADEELWRPAYLECVKLLGVPEKAIPHSDADPNYTAEELAARKKEQEAIREADARWQDSAKQRGPSDPKTLEEMNRLAEAYDTASRWREAAQIMRQLVEARESNSGPDHADTIAAMKRLGDFYRRAGMWTEGEALYKELTERSAAKLGRDHQDTLKFQSGIAGILLGSGRVREAVSLLEQIEEIRRTKFGQDDPARLNTLYDLGIAYYRDGRHDDVDRLARDLLERRKQQGGPESNDVAQTLTLLGMNLLAQKRYAVAEKTLRESLTLSTKNKQPEWQQFRLSNLLGASLAGQGKHAEAEPLLLDGYEGMNRSKAKIPAPWKWYLDAAGQHVVHFYESTGAVEKAKLWREKLGFPD